MIRSDYPLTKADIKALRTADTVAFDYNGNTSYAGIRCIKRANKSNPWEQELTVKANASAELYRGHYHEWLTDVRACHVIVSSSYDEFYQTFAGLLREGDVIFLEFVSLAPAPDDKDGCYLDHAMCTLSGYYGEMLWRDSLRLHILRGDKKLSFLIAESVTPDNSAKMVKVHGR